MSGAAESRHGETPPAEGSRRARVGTLLVLGATLGFAFKGVFARLAYATGLPGETVLLLRMLVAAPFFAFALGLLRYRDETATILRSDWARAAAVGVLFVSSGAADFFAIERIGAGPSRVILFSHPAMVLAYQALTRGKRPSARQKVAFGGAWMGLWLAAGFGPGSTEASLDPLGVSFALASAVGYSAYLLTSHELMSRMGSAPFICMANLTGLVYVLGIECAAGLIPTAPIPTGAWPPILGLVLFSTVLPAFAFTEGLHRLGAAKASLLSLVGPPTTIAAAAIVVGESLGGTQLLGCALVLLSVSQLRQPRAQRSPTPKPRAKWNIAPSSGQARNTAARRPPLRPSAHL
jgi:drug/metabolite transporter (DMT)-like permease